MLLQISESSKEIKISGKGYDRKLPERRARDYDNIEMKKLLDVVASYILTDNRDEPILTQIFPVSGRERLQLLRIEYSIVEKPKLCKIAYHEFRRPLYEQAHQQRATHGV